MLVSSSLKASLKMFSQKKNCSNFSGRFSEDFVRDLFSGDFFPGFFLCGDFIVDFFWGHLFSGDFFPRTIFYTTTIITTILPLYYCVEIFCDVFRCVDLVWVVLVCFNLTCLVFVNFVIYRRHLDVSPYPLFNHYITSPSNKILLVSSKFSKQ